jgi:hypothetical protein
MKSAQKDDKLAHLTKVQSLIDKERSTGKQIVYFHISSPGQMQFSLPIYRELLQRDCPVSCYLTTDYQMPDVEQAFGLCDEKCILAEFVTQLKGVDLFLQPEIHGRGPKDATRVMIGHGQPNKHTNWAEENLRAFDVYFLYGPLLREMFEQICEEKPEATKHIRLLNTGYPKLDEQITGKIDQKSVLEKLGLPTSNRTVIYAPAWDPGGSLREFGMDVVETLLDLPDTNLLVKLHPVSLEPVNSQHFEFYTGGVEWEKVFKKLESEHPNFRYINEWVINPYLVASDLMVTDFSGVALEYMTLDRPVIYLECPKFYQETLVTWKNDPHLAKTDDRFNAGRNYGTVANHVNELAELVKKELASPCEKSQLRSEFIKKFLYNPGNASKKTVDAIIELLEERA